MRDASTIGLEILLKALQMVSKIIIKVFFVAYWMFELSPLSCAESCEMIISLDFTHNTGTIIIVAVVIGKMFLV